MTKDEELAIVREVLSGHTDRFEALILAHQKGIYNLCLRMLGNEQDALDASQEAFFRAWRGLSGFRGESRFSVWLYRLASNVCLDMLRKRPGSTSVSLINDEGEPLPLPDEKTPSPQETMERTELRQAVNAGLTELPEDFRLPLVLRDINGLSYEEIGQTLSLEPGTVKSRIFRARKRLALILMRGGNLSDYLPSQSSEKGGENHV